MSGCQKISRCPECEGKFMRTYSDSKPFSQLRFETVNGECLSCGFIYWTETGQLTLKEVNKIRKENKLSPLKRLKEV